MLTHRETSSCFEDDLTREQPRSSARHRFLCDTNKPTAIAATRRWQHRHTARWRASAAIRTRQRCRRVVRVAQWRYAFARATTLSSSPTTRPGSNAARAYARVQTLVRATGRQQRERQRVETVERGIAASSGSRARRDHIVCLPDLGDQRAAGRAASRTGYSMPRTSPASSPTSRREDEPGQRQHRHRRTDDDTTRTHDRADLSRADLLIRCARAQPHQARDNSPLPVTSEARNEQDGPRTSIAATAALRSDSRHELHDSRYATVTSGTRSRAIRGTRTAESVPPRGSLGAALAPGELPLIAPAIAH